MARDLQAIAFEPAVMSAAVAGRRPLLMLAGFFGWAVLLDAPARLKLTVP